MDPMDFSQLGQFLPDLNDLNSKMEKMQQRLATEVVTAESGGGMVKISGYANMRVQNVEMDSALLSMEDMDMTSDLIAAAFNQFIEKCHERTGEITTQELGALGAMMRNSPFAPHF